MHEHHHRLHAVRIIDISLAICEAERPVETDCLCHVARGVEHHTAKAIRRGQVKQCCAERPSDALLASRAGDIHPLHLARIGRAHPIGDASDNFRAIQRDQRAPIGRAIGGAERFELPVERLVTERHVDQPLLRRIALPAPADIFGDERAETGIVCG